MGVKLDDYMEGGERHGLPLEDDEPEVPEFFSVGDHVVVDHCPAYEYEGRMAIVREVHPEREGCPYRGHIEGHYPANLLWFTASSYHTSNGDGEDRDDAEGFSVGDRVIIDVCPCFEDYNGTVALIEEIDRDRYPSNPYRGPIEAHGGGSLWFSASRLAGDDDEEGEDDGRPTSGDVVIVHELDEEHITLPQIVEIKRDDHDNAPYYAEFLTDDDDDDALEGCYFTEQQCTVYVGNSQPLPRYAEGAEVLKPGIVEYDEGTMVRIDVATECPEHVGKMAKIVRTDMNDANLTYLVEIEDHEKWVNEVTPLDDGEVWLRQREVLWEEYNTARRALLDHLGEGRRRPNITTMAEILAVKHQAEPRSRVLRAVKDLRFWSRHKDGVTLTLREAKDLIDQAYRTLEDQ